MLPWIYLSGPYSSNPCENTWRACYLWSRLTKKYEGKAVVICPHWSHFQNTMHPMTHEQWMQYDLNLLRVLSKSPGVVFRMMGDSPGADREVALAKELAIPVATTEAVLHGMVETMIQCPR